MQQKRQITSLYAQDEQILSQRSVFSNLNVVVYAVDFSELLM